jgi:TRAP-type C4-dicarboxylate transport system permease small subunit
MTAVQLVLLVATSDPRPNDNNVVAGWTGFAVLIGLIIAVVFILRSFTKQLKKVEAAREAGVYDEKPAGDPTLPPTHVDHDR